MKTFAHDDSKRLAARKMFPVALAAAATLLAGPSRAANAAAPSSVAPFQITGFIEAATLDSTCTSSAHCGGTITVNGQTVLVPKDSLVVFPSFQLNWQQIFAVAGPPYGMGGVRGPASGLALKDFPAPAATYEVTVVGTHVLPGVAGAETYVASLVAVSPVVLNGPTGFTNFMERMFAPQ